MFFFNFLFWVCGTLILGLAIWVRVSKDGKEIITSGDSSTNPFIAVNILIAVGSIIMVLGAAFKPEYNRILNETLYENAKLLSDNTDEAKDFQKAMIVFQSEFKCCGLENGAADWGNNFVEAKESCQCTGTDCATYQGSSVYPKTCLSLIKDLFEKNIIIVIGIAFGLAVIEILGLVFSMVLYCQIGSK